MNIDQPDKLCHDDPRIRTGEENVLVLEEWISHIDQLEIKTNESWLLVSLLKSSRRAYRHLRGGWPCDSTYTAWACRNLIELRIFAKFISVSPENLKRFICDLPVDSEKAATKLTELVLHVEPGIDLSENPLSKINSSMREILKFDGKKYLHATDEAKKLGLDKEILPMYEMCSLLVHPTAKSIFGIDMEDQNERDVYLLFGFKYLGELLDDIIPLAEVLVHGKVD